ncbi:MAG: PilZ domain-containing protein [Candidatus Brocadiaceae bacterium]|nr:PilZ domain-containing protein [Candidatus Brocadiaceae bacterium]
MRKDKLDRRAGRRFDLQLLLSLYDRDVETKNISATGVYFEVVTDCINTFTPGSRVSFLLTVDTTTQGSGTIRINYYGNGIIVRNNIRNVTSDGNQMGVGVEFVDKLNISECFTPKSNNTYSQIEEKNT